MTRYIMLAALALLTACGSNPVAVQDVPEQTVETGGIWKGQGNMPVTVPSIDVTPNSLALTVGGESSFSYVLTGGSYDRYEVTWRSTDSSVATVSSAGLVKAIGEGTATIIAEFAFRSDDGGLEIISVQRSVSVSAASGITSLAMTVHSVSTGDSDTTFTATVNGRAGEPYSVSYSASGSGLGTVSLSRTGDSGTIPSNGRIFLQARIVSWSGTAHEDDTVTVTVSGGGFSASDTETVSGSTTPTPDPPPAAVAPAITLTYDNAITDLETSLIGAALSGGNYTTIQAYSAAIASGGGNLTAVDTTGPTRSWRFTPQVGQEAHQGRITVTVRVRRTTAGSASPGYADATVTATATIDVTPGSKLFWNGKRVNNLNFNGRKMSRAYWEGERKL